MAKTDLTAERVRELFDYNPDTGILTARRTGKKRYAGDAVGCRAISTQGRETIVISIDGYLYLAHRVIWLYVHGVWPTYTIDHINCVPTDNRIDNLRDVTQLENSRNKPMSKGNKSGIVGVSWRESKKKWRAYVTVLRKQTHLGYFDNVADAISARQDAINRIGFGSMHGVLR